jgi:hypothetical protein
VLVASVSHSAAGRTESPRVERMSRGPLLMGKVQKQSRSLAVWRKRGAGMDFLYAAFSAAPPFNSNVLPLVYQRGTWNTSNMREPQIRYRTKLTESVCFEKLTRCR